MPGAKLGAAVILACALTACSDPAPPAGIVHHEARVSDATPTTATTEVVQTPEAPTEPPEPLEVTTTTAYDWGPVLCPGPHPAHHKPCPAQSGPPVTKAPYRAPAVVSAPAEGSGACAAIPAAVVARESGCQNIPNAQGSGCDGYYQICRGTWDNYGGYPDALSAPKEVQDAKAAELAAEPNGLCRHWQASGGCG